MKLKCCLIIFVIIFFSNTSEAQTYSLSQIKEALTARLDNTPKELTYIHTDREVYIVGEEVLFKIYVISIPNIDTTAISKVCYLNLCNKEGKILQTQVLKVKDKSANGVLALSKNLDAGEYNVVATTMYMQNFNNKTAHYKKINIIKSVTEKQVNKANKLNDFEVGFFPESGSLVSGIDQKIGVRSLNENGESIDVDIKIKNSKNEILQTFSTGMFGLTSFTLNAQANETYTAECAYKKNNVVKSVKLPIVESKAATLSINNQKKVFIQINDTDTTFSKKYFVLGSMNGVVVFEAEFTLPTSTNVFALSKANLPTGLLKFHLINANAQVIAERYAWIENNSITENPTINIKKAIGKKRREAAEVEIDFKKNIDANISISVSRTQFADTSELNMYQYTQLLINMGNKLDYTNSDLRKIWSEKYSLDNLLIVNGWKKFSPINLMVDEPLKYTNENGIYVAGKITKAQTKTIIPNSKLDLIVLNADSTKYIYSEPSNKDGEFIFKDLSISKNSNLFYSGTNLAKGNALIDVNFYKHFTDTLKSFMIPKVANAFQNNFSLLLDTFEAGKFKLLQEVRVNSKRTTEIEKFDKEYTSALFENADQSIILKNEPNSITIWQLLQRNIPGITITNSEEGRLVYFNRYFGVDAFSENGLGTVQFFLNEQPVSQFEIEGLLPEDIAYIKVYKGGLGYVLGAPRGGIAFYTVKGKKNGDWRDKGFTKLNLKGYEPTYQVYNMEYSKVNISNPNLDYRPTLYWIPTKILKSQQKINFTFYSDDKENCQWLIKVNGITNNNIPIFAKEIIE
jgi:hypothetical protein